jgi:hypothetical protein
MLKTDDEQRPSTTRAGVAVEQITVLVRDNGFVPAGSALVLHGNTKDDATRDQRSDTTMGNGGGSLNELACEPGLQFARAARYKRSGKRASAVRLAKVDA